MNATVIQLSSYRYQPKEPMSKRTFEAGLKSITKRIERNEVTADQGYMQISRLIDEYFFPEVIEG